MKNGKALFLSAAVILGAAGMILGNQVLASSALIEGGAQEPAIVMPEETHASAIQLSDVSMYSNPDGGIYIAPANRSAEALNQEKTQTANEPNSTETNQSPANANLSEEEAKQVGVKAIAEKFGLTQDEVDRFDVTIYARYSASQPSSEREMLLWCVRLTPIDQKDYPTLDSYSAMFDDSSLELVKVGASPLIKEGTPLANELSSEKARELGISAIVEKYALTQKTLDRFTVTVKYFEVTPEAPGRHAWWVNLYPADNDDFSEIGCYWTYIDAETGDMLQLNSAADGKG